MLCVTITQQEFERNIKEIKKSSKTSIDNRNFWDYNKDKIRDGIKRILKNKFHLRN